MTRLRRVEKKSNIRVDLGSTEGLYTVRLNARTIGKNRERERSSKNVLEGHRVK